MPTYTVKQRAPDIVAIAALLAVVVIALGIVSRIIDAAAGGGIIVALVCAAGVAQFMKAKRFATQANAVPQNKRRERDFQFTTAGGTRTIVFGTEDILAIAALLAVVILALAISFRSVETGAGGTIIIALVGAAGIAEFMKAKRSASKEGQA